MGFESFLRRSTGNEEEPLKKEVERYQKEKRIGKLLTDRANRLARMAVVGLTLQGCAPGEGSKQQQTPTQEQSVASELLDRQISTGTIRLSSGEVLGIPKSGERFDSVTVYLPKERPADRLLLVFGQIHQLPKENLDTFDADTKNTMLREVMESQRAIYEGLKDMAQRGTISKVCSELLLDTDKMLEMESYYRDSLPEITASIVAKYLPESDIGRVVERRDELFVDDYLSSEEYDELRSSIEPAIRQYQDEYRYAVSADGLLAAEGKVRLCPAASKETYDAAWEPQVDDLFDKPSAERTSAEQTLIRKVIFEDREDAAVALAVSQAEKSIAITYGAAHDFSDAVERWNKNNPNIQIGLVEVSADSGSQEQ